MSNFISIQKKYYKIMINKKNKMYNKYFII